MALAVHIVPGPPSAHVSREEAENTLTSHPRFPKSASFTLAEVEGRWVAAVAADDKEEDEKEEQQEKEAAKTAAPFPPSGGGDEAPSGPPTDGPPSDLGDESGDDEGKPKDEKKPGDEKGGEKGELHELISMMHMLMSALGLAPGPDDSMVPGPDDPPGPPAGPPAGPDASGPDGKTHTVHERALKPGEAQPGSTPIGAPAFASVNNDHPWSSVLGKKRSFSVEEEIGDQPLSEVHRELSQLANGTGYEVKQLVEGHTGNTRTAKAIIARA
jgi:hypothetical protein